MAFSVSVRLPGDIVAILDSSKNVVVSYVYDAWGRAISMTGSMAGTLGKINPFRYRGYVYDEETGLYYVATRHYCAELGRWMVPDDIDALNTSFENVAQYNLFAYCFNTPVNTYDDLGTWPNWVKKAVAVVAVAAVVVAATVLTVATCGAGSVAGVAAITTTLTLSARTAEVIALQSKKSTIDGKNSTEVVGDCFEAVYDNGPNIVGFLPVTKPLGVTAKHAINSYMATASGIPYTFKDTLLIPGGKVIGYGMAGYAWFQTTVSILSDDPVERAHERGYELK